MKVVAFNGSPRREGNTYQAIRMVAEELEKAGIETEIIHVGNKALSGCIACGKCIVNRDERCTIDDEVNEWIQKMKSADGILFGSPVHFSGIAGNMKSFLDRAFYVCGVNKGLLRHKVGAAVVAVRRSGGVATCDQLNHYISYAEMLMPASNYWNVIHGQKPGEVLQDEEGKQIMRLLGRNMAWLMKLVDKGGDLVPEPEAEKKTYTNFIR
ncbi:MAG: flavodoxin family protein [Bacillota bacterium]|jgi:multimeric flavodoxin WrbA|nr:flavodoxin family protein [Bacillota bacterium]NLM08581.1 flavodoxin family protein [Clostridiales Family XIII bacterium]HAF60080.1 flavodoxin family protein [Clostridiales bacterium UBA9856]HOA43098.1 flavodoxin family protein [Bacillota bacterium]HPZ59888.1 flavodoxin family protein [Bacillota bacterium]